MASPVATPVSPSGTINTLSPVLQFTVDSTFNDLIVEVRGGFGGGAGEVVVWSAFVGSLVTPPPGGAGSYSLPYSGTPLVDGIPYKWRLQARNVPITGDLSAYMTFTPSINHPPTAAIVAPVAGAQPGTVTPSLVLGFADTDSGANGTFSAYQVQVRRVSDGLSFWDPGQTAVTAAEASARQATKIYAGTALAPGTAYEWRARVQDGGGLWSDYTAWTSFTPKVAPNAPAVVGPAGLQSTITPTVSGTYSQGAGGLEAAFQYQIRQGALTIYESGDVATAIATGQAYGTNNPADTPATPPALVWGTSYTIRMRSKDAAAAYSDWSGWTAFSTNSPPSSPTSLSPSGGAVTGDTTPTLTWVHNDPDSDAQTAVEIEIYDLTAAAFVVNYNPKALTQATLTHDVLTALTIGNNYRWRIRTKGLAAAGFGPWSDYALFTVAATPTVTVTAPAAAATLTAPAFAVTWTFSGGSGTQQDWRVQVFAANQSTVIYDSGVTAGAALTHNVPAGYLRNTTDYYIRVTVRDTLSIQATSSFILVHTAWTPPAAITGLAVVAVGDQT